MTTYVIAYAISCVIMLILACVFRGKMGLFSSFKVAAFWCAFWPLSLVAFAVASLLLWADTKFQTVEHWWQNPTH